MPETNLPQTETGETLKSNKPVLSVLLLRHGESAKDKTDPRRGLTDLGVSQVEEATHKLINQIIAEERPDFVDFGDVEKRRTVFSEMAPNISLRLYDSGTDRTLQQVQVERRVFEEMGAARIYVPQSVIVYDIATQNRPHQLGELATGRGVPGRLEGIAGVDQDKSGFRQKIADTEYQKKLGASDELVAWALSPDD